LIIVDELFRTARAAAIPFSIDTHNRLLELPLTLSSFLPQLKNNSFSWDFLSSGDDLVIVVIFAPGIKIFCITAFFMISLI
jgi:hypothetical protein